ncbi:MAG TPA: dynamin family protein [Myxococcaceae bacterium]|nr:dynamin family protein [Myxococcaceae bacterium]
MVPRIQTLQELAREAKCAGLAEEAERLAEQARAGGYFVACLGQFKRGKSSLLNALLGKAVLPTGVAPVTSVATVIRFGPEAGARVRFAGGPGWQGIPRAAIADYVTEERNPGNEKGVRAVEIFEPARRLAAGMCLVDTPGIGSVILENTEATRAFVPRIDAALVVLGGDPPISGEELELVRQVAEHVDRFVFVLNKADRLSEAELAEARAFNLRTLERSLVGAPVELLDVSAAEHLSGRGPTRDWRRLEAWLDDLSSTSGPRLAAEAAQRGARRVASQLAALLEEQRLALVRPVAESEARVARLGTVVAAAEQSLGTLSVAFLAEEERLRHALEDQRQRFLARALPAAHASLAEALRPGHGRAGRRRQEAMRTAEAVARRWIETWVEQEVPEAEARYREAFGRLVVMAVDFLSRAAQQPGLERLGRESEFDVGFRVSSHRYFTDLLHLTMASPLDWLLDLGLPAAVRRRSVRRHAERYLERLMEANSSRVQFDLDERVRESGRKLEQEVRARLRDVLTISASALESARRTTSAGAAAVQAELARLELLARRARALDTPTPGETPR